MHAARERRLMRQLLESNKLNSLYNKGLKVSWGMKSLGAPSNIMHMYKDVVFI